MGKIKSKDKLISKLIKKYKREDNKINLVDIGAGDQFLKKIMPKNIIYNSLDIDPKNSPDVLCDLNETFPLKDNSYDFVVCTEVLEHTFYPRKIIQEIKRITKEDGIIIITLPNEYNFYLRLKFLLGVQNNTEIPFREELWKNHIHRAKVNDLIKLYKEEFDVQEITYSWDSFSGKNFFLYIDKFIRNFLMPLSKNLFSRSVILVGRKK